MWARNATRCLTLDARQSFIRPLWCQNTGTVDDERAGTRGNSGRGAGPRRKAARVPATTWPPSRRARSSAPCRTTPPRRCCWRWPGGDRTTSPTHCASSSRSPPRNRAGQPHNVNSGWRSAMPGAARKPSRRCARPCACNRRWPMPGAPWATTCMRWAIPQAPTRPTPTTSAIRRATPGCMEPALALAEGRIAVAEPLLRNHLQQFPTDVAAIRMLAEIASRIGRYTDAENLLTRCLELAPGFKAARHNYAVVLHRNNKPVEALAQIDQLLATDPRSPSFRNLKATVLARVGEYDEAIRLYEQLLREYPLQAKVWLSHGHALKTAGRQDDSIAAYRKSIELEPRLGEAYWSLANLKTFRFTRGRRRRDARAARAQRPHPGRPLPLPLRARQGRRGRAGLRRLVPPLRGRQSPAQGSRCPTTAARSPRTCAVHVRCSRPSSLRRAAAWGARRPTRSSSWGCRVRGRRWSSRSCRAIRRSKARWNCRTSSASSRN